MGWQNEIRDMFGMAPTSPTIWPVVVVVTVSIAPPAARRRACCASRPHVRRPAGPAPAPRLAVVLGVGVLVVLFWGLWSGVIVNGFFAGANAVFAAQDPAG